MKKSLMTKLSADLLPNFLGNMYIIPFIQISEKSISLVGEKGLSLGSMTRAKFPVPEGFVITAKAFRSFLKDSGLLVIIKAELAKVNIEEMHSVDYSSRIIMEQIKNAKISDTIAVEVMQQFTTVNCSFFAVRSSAFAKEKHVSWSGELDTYLHVNASNLLDKIQDCWASLFSVRSIFYILQQGYSYEEINMAVVIQKMIDSRVSGIVYTAHPVTRDKNQMIIEAGLGLGKAIVEGDILPDTYTVQKDPYEVLSKNIKIQTMKLDVERESGITSRKVSSNQGKNQKLTDDQIKKLTKLCISVEEYFKTPVSIEWTFEEQFFILQAREMTEL